MAKLLRLALLVCAALSTLVWAAHLVGQDQAIPNRVAQLHLTDCAPPCWIGITPGMTSIAQAKAKIVATYGGQHPLTIKDSGFADGAVSPNVVENTIEGANFNLSIRLNISQLIDGKSEIVQSIELFEAGGDNHRNALSVADILGLFGSPQAITVDESISLAPEVTLKYPHMDAVFYAYTDQAAFSGIPRLYLGDSTTPSPSTDYRPWKGLNTLSLTK